MIAQAKAVMLGSGRSVEWSTPQDFFDRYDAVFHFTLDAAASADNAKCEQYLTVDDDGLTHDWNRETVWLNPPFGRGIGRWMAKAYEASRRGATVVCLIPARVDTAWWHDFVEKGEYHFPRGRLTFGGATHNAPFPVAVVVFRPPMPSWEKGVW